VVVVVVAAVVVVARVVVVAGAVVVVVVVDVVVVEDVVVVLVEDVVVVVEDVVVGRVEDEPGSPDVEVGSAPLEQAAKVTPTHVSRIHRRIVTSSRTSRLRTVVTPNRFPDARGTGPHSGRRRVIRCSPPSRFRSSPQCWHRVVIRSVWSIRRQAPGTSPMTAPTPLPSSMGILGISR
jgi:hypothetical protein